MARSETQLLNNIIRTIFGQNLKVARERKQLSRQDVANCLDMTPQNYARIERGDQGMGYEKLAEISQLLGVPIDDLFSMKPTEPLLSASEVLLLEHYRLLDKGAAEATNKLLRVIYLAQPSSQFIDTVSALIIEASKANGKLSG